MYVVSMHLVSERIGALLVVFPNYPTKKEIIAEFFKLRTWSAAEWQSVLQKFVSIIVPTKEFIDMSPCGAHISFSDTNIVLTFQRAAVACQA